MGFKFLSVFLSILFFQVVANAQSTTKVLGTINGLQITQEELQREMRQYRWAIVAGMSQKARTQEGDFWNTAETGGVKPIILLRKMALDSLAKIKVQEQLLRERKLWPYATYQAFLQDMHQTNASRKQGNKQVSYGPLTYAEQVFFDYRFTNALIQLKHQLVAEKLIPVTEADLTKQFEKMRLTVYQDEAKYTLREFTRQVKEAYIEKAYAGLINQYTKKAQVKVSQQALSGVQLN